MGKYKLVRFHVRSSVRAAMAESNGFEDEAERLRAQGYLRLIVMSDDELWELARVLSHLPARPAKTVYHELKQVIENRKKASSEWIGEFGVQPVGLIAKN